MQNTYMLHKNNLPNIAIFNSQLRVALIFLLFIFALATAFTAYIDRPVAQSSPVLEQSNNQGILPIAGTVKGYGLATDWPVKNVIFSSTFGPRLKKNENTNFQSWRYDFHRGLDIPGNLNDPVTAFADGEIFRVYSATDPASPYYADGGNVVVLRHTLPKLFSFHGKNITTIYSLYMHLNEINVAAPVKNSSGQYVYQKISRNTLVGKIGSTGTTEKVHLHFEIRVGSTCSYESQKNGSCTTTVFSTPTDPHVSPFYFVNYPTNQTNNLSATVLSYQPLTIRVSSSRAKLDFNELGVTNGAITKRINLTTREGIDMDNFDSAVSLNNITIDPAVFNSTTNNYEITFRVNDWNRFGNFTVKDIWGRGIKITK